MPYFLEHAMHLAGWKKGPKEGSYFSRKYPHKFSQLICTSCADDLQPAPNAARSSQQQVVGAWAWMWQLFGIAGRSPNCHKGSHVSSLLPLMNTCAAIKPFFMVESHVRNYLVHLRTRQVESGCKVGATLCLTRPEEKATFFRSRRPKTNHSKKVKIFSSHTYAYL